MSEENEKTENPPKRMEWIKANCGDYFSGRYMVSKDEILDAWFGSIDGQRLPFNFYSVDTACAFCLGHSAGVKEKRR